MPKTLINQNTGDIYTDQGGANINSVYQSRGGWVTLPAQVYAQISHSPEGATQGEEQWSEEFVLPSGAHYLQPGLIGIRFRSFTAGNPVAVSAALFFRDEPAMQLGGSGISTPSSSVASLNFQHNDVAVATEPTADFEDQTGSNTMNLTWTVVDDPANTRVKITPVPVWGNPTIFPNDFSNGPGSNAVGGATAGVYVEKTGRVLITRAANSSPTYGSAITGDTFWRFQADTNGLLTWGTGAAAGDATLQRTAVATLQTNSFWQVVNTSGIAVQNAIGNTSYRIFTAFTDANPTFSISGTTISWGVGGATATDTSMFRSVTGPPSSGGGPFISTPNAYLVTSTVGFVVASAVNNQAFASYFSAADANPAFKIFTQGALTWGPGGASTTDLELARLTNSPTGTGTFLELIVGSGLGYGTGTGGTVTQVTSLSTGVTINKPTGQIVTFASALAAGLITSFVVTNSVVGAQDTIIVSWNTIVQAGIPIFVSGIGAGSFTICYVNNGALSASQANKINFAVIKGSTS